MHRGISGANGSRLGAVGAGPDRLCFPSELDELPAEFPDGPGVLPRLHCGSHILSTAPQGEQAVCELVGGLARQDQRIGGDGGPGEVTTLFIGSLTAGVTAVAAAASSPGLRDLPTAPGAVDDVRPTAVGTLGNMG